MLRKLASYVLLSFLSFTVFTALFHTVANAQTAELIVAPTPRPTINPPSYAPATTGKSPHKPQVIFTLSSVDTPTPTTEPTKAPLPTATPEPTALPKKAVIIVTVIPTVAPTAPLSPTVIPTIQPTVISPADLESLFGKYADEYKVDKEDLKRIAKCEAGFNTNADTGLYAGMYQFSAETWMGTRRAMGLDTNPDLRKNAEEAIRTAAYKISNGGRGAWPNC